VESVESDSTGGSRPGCAPNNWFYSWDEGLVHFVAVSTELYFHPEHLAHGAARQRAWLQKDLAAANLPARRAQVPWVIVFGHRPLYNGNCPKGDCSPNVGGPLVSGGCADCCVDPGKCSACCPGNASTVVGLETLFFEHGVDIYVGGHVHDYERMYDVHLGHTYGRTTDMRATTYITTGDGGSDEGTGGAPLLPPRSSAFRSNAAGYSAMEVVNASHLHWQQVQTEATEMAEYGKVIDDVWLVQHRHGSFAGRVDPLDPPLARLWKAAIFNVVHDNGTATFSNKAMVASTDQKTISKTKANAQLFDFKRDDDVTTVQRGRSLGWWLHADRNLSAVLAVMSRQPALFSSVSVFRSNYSIAPDGSLLSPLVGSVEAWLLPLRRAVPRARINIVLGGGHSYPPSAPLPAAARNPLFAPAVARQLRQHRLNGVNLDWENGETFENASKVLVAVIGQLSHALAPDGRTVSLCVASGWMQYLDHGSWRSYEEAGAHRLMTMSTYPLTQPFSMRFEQQVLDSMVSTVRLDTIGIGLWPKRGRGWNEQRLHTFLSYVNSSGVNTLDVFCADLWGGAEPPEPFWLPTLAEWLLHGPASDRSPQQKTAKTDDDSTIVVPAQGVAAVTLQVGVALTQNARTTADNVDFEPPVLLTSGGTDPREIHPTDTHMLYPLGGKNVLFQAFGYTQPAKPGTSPLLFSSDSGSSWAQPPGPTGVVSCGVDGPCSREKPSPGCACIDLHMTSSTAAVDGRRGVRGYRQPLVGSTPASVARARFVDYNATSFTEYTATASGAFGRTPIDSQSVFTGVPRAFDGSVLQLDPGEACNTIILQDGSQLMCALVGSPGCWASAASASCAQINRTGVPTSACVDGGMCPGPTLVALQSTDGSAGRRWRFKGIIYQAKSIFVETNMAVLGDGKTLIAVMRVSGNGGCGNIMNPSDPIGTWHTTSDYRWYHQSYSTSNGATWSTPTPIIGAGCCRPRLISFPGGPLVIAGGRMCVNGTQGLFLWISSDGMGAYNSPNHGADSNGSEWARVSITDAHNRGLNRSAPAAHRFTDQVNASEGWQTQAEVGLIAAGDPAAREALVTYNRYGTPPPGGHPSGGSIGFSMQMRFASSAKSDDEGARSLVATVAAGIPMPLYVDSVRGKDRNTGSNSFAISVQAPAPTVEVAEAALEKIQLPLGWRRLWQKLDGGGASASVKAGPGKLNSQY
jgi:hypothetical protein